MPQSSTHEHLALGGAVGERRAQREADHLLGRALAVVARLRAVGHTTAAPVRRADRALAGAAGALLAPRLRATTADLGPGLRAVRARPGGGELRGDDLVHDRDVRLDAEQLVGHVDRAGVRAGRRLHVELHAASPCAAGTTGRFAALLTNTRPPLGPGTAPLTRRRPRSASPSTTSRFWRGDAAVAVLAGHLHALEHPGRRGAGADRTRRAVLLVVPVRRALALEVVALHRAGEALALADAGDVDPLAGTEHVGADHLADLEAGEVVDPQLGEVALRRRVGLLEVPELGLREALGLGVAERELDGRVAVALGRLELDDAAGPGFDHRHRDDAVLVVPDLGHAELAPEDPFGRHDQSRCSFSLHANAPPGGDPGGASIGCAAWFWAGHGPACADFGWRTRSRGAHGRGPWRGPTGEPGKTTGWPAKPPSRSVVRPG